MVETSLSSLSLGAGTGAPVQQLPVTYGGHRSALSSPIKSAPALPPGGPGSSGPSADRPQLCAVRRACPAPSLARPWNWTHTDTCSAQPSRPAPDQGKQDLGGAFIL